MSHRFNSSTLLLCNYRPSEIKIIYLLNISSSLLTALSEAGFTLVLITILHLRVFIALIMASLPKFYEVFPIGSHKVLRSIMMVTSFEDA